MILEQETFDAFGYYPKDLKPQSHKKIIAVCDGCGKARVISKKAYHALCKSCAKKGHTVSNEAKRKIGEARKGKIGEDANRWKGGPVKRTCKVCGKTFYANRYRVENGKEICCSLSCAKKGKTGDKCSAWKGGLSFEPYCIKFNDAYKRKIREQFSNKCFFCGMAESNNGRKLDIHHVTYNKDCGCDSIVCICVPLCRSCHAKTNSNRSYWQKLIMRKLKNTLAGW